ncbi:DUF1858 domain-containing protein [Candidatus Pacearchaeota archaeon]|nr:DUF1858 domain-containing protein [Candidatus Pacearchaeota archaeon]
MKKITLKTKLGKILDINADAAEILFGHGLSCIGCPMAMEETLEEGCLAHGMNKQDIAKLVKILNEKEE